MGSSPRSIDCDLPDLIRPEPAIPRGFRFLRICLAVLFTNSIFTKIRYSEQFLLALENGYQTPELLIYPIYIAVLLTLCVLVAMLVFGHPVIGLSAAGCFMFAGAAFALVLRSRLYTGECGCGPLPSIKGVHPLSVRAGHNIIVGTVCAITAFWSHKKG